MAEQINTGVSLPISEVPPSGTPAAKTSDSDEMAASKRATAEDELAYFGTAEFTARLLEHMHRAKRKAIDDAERR
jgi:hypothetical protein